MQLARASGLLKHSIGCDFIFSRKGLTAFAGAGKQQGGAMRAGAQQQKLGGVGAGGNQLVGQLTRRGVGAEGGVSAQAGTGVGAGGAYSFDDGLHQLPLLGGADAHPAGRAVLRGEPFRVF